MYINFFIITLVRNKPLHKIITSYFKWSRNSHARTLPKHHETDDSNTKIKMLTLSHSIKIIGTLIIHQYVVC